VPGRPPRPNRCTPTRGPCPCRAGHREKEARAEPVVTAEAQRAAEHGHLGGIQALVGHGSDLGALAPRRVRPRRSPRSSGTPRRRPMACAPGRPAGAAAGAGAIAGSGPRAPIRRAGGRRSVERRGPVSVQVDHVGRGVRGPQRLGEVLGDAHGSGPRCRWSRSRRGPARGLRSGRPAAHARPDTVAAGVAEGLALTARPALRRALALALEPGRGPAPRARVGQVPGAHHPDAASAPAAGVRRRALEMQHPDLRSALLRGDG
jgi:hypothetical protein